MYTTEQAMVDRFGLDEMILLTDTDGSGRINSDRLATAISDAQTSIDSYLAGRYELPISNAERLTSYASNIARYYLYDNQVPELVQQRYKDAIAFLKSIARGEASLGDDEGSDPETHDAAEVVSGGNVWDRKDTSFI